MDPRPEIDWHRLARYLSGEHASEREAEVRAWILEDERRAGLMDELKQVWDATGRSIRSRDVDAAWETVSRNLASGSSGADGGAKVPEEEILSDDPAGNRPTQTDEEGQATRSRKQRRPRGRWQLFSRVAAVGGAVVVVALLATLLFYEVPFTSPDEDVRTFTTEPGQRATIRRDDGSEGRVNGDSRLVLPADLGDEKRKVHLEGEAYFEVARDTTRPFTIQVEGATAEVLGTAFDVKAYPDDEEKKVAVAEGKVVLRPKQSKVQETVLLNAQSLGVVSGHHVQVVRKNADIGRQLAWTKGRLVFDDAPFEEVLRRLERWYDITIEARLDPGTVDRLNATFEEESSDKAIKAIATALDLRYRKNGRTVIFYRRGNASGRPSR
jgi:ferric-dicitrate binding protein FerR (iron transport regulator)